jgi:transposase-like protein
MRFMIKTGKRIKPKRVFSEEFKKKLVADFESGAATVRMMQAQYNISSSALYRWIYTYSKYNEKNVRIVEMKDSQTQRLKELEQKVKELERAVGQKQIKIDFLEKMIELAEDHYAIDVKKNSSIQPSGGSSPTAKD